MKSIFKSAYYGFRWLVIRMRVMYYHLLKNKLVFILGTPLHNNIGDLAIMMAEVNFICKKTDRRAIAIDMQTLNRNRDKVARIVSDGDIITAHGGGNIGDTYPEEESVRRFIIKEFQDRRVMIFPQTIFYSNTSRGRIYRDQSSRLYAQHPNLTIIAREVTTLKIAQEVFKKNNVILTPDIVLSLNLQSGSKVRVGVMTCLRADLEKTLDENGHRRIDEFAKQVSDKITHTDTIFSGRFFYLRPKVSIVKSKLAEFRGSELVITDRLHGMVFAAITGTPCIVFANFNHKVKGTYDWIKDLGYIQYCESIDDLEKVDVEKLMKSAKTYDPSRFDEYWKLIHKELKDK